MLRSLVPWRERPVVPSTDRYLNVFDQMEREMQDLVGKFWGGDGGQLVPKTEFAPRVDMIENENGFEVKVDLPGLKPEEVTVEYRKGALWISGERKEEKEEKGETYHRIERSYGEFRRVLPLPAEVVEDKIEAKFSEGVLNITVPKTEEIKPRQIEVKA